MTTTDRTATKRVPMDSPRTTALVEKSRHATPKAPTQIPPSGLSMAAMSDTFFAISYTPAFAPIFWIVGLGPRWSGVWVGPDSVRVKMGWGFRAEIPRQAVREIGPDGAVARNAGAHGQRGEWLVNGSLSGLVRLEIEPEVQARVMGVPVRLRTLRLSLAAPDEFIRMLKNSR